MVTAKSPTMISKGLLAQRFIQEKPFISGRINLISRNRRNASNINAGNRQLEMATSA